MIQIPDPIELLVMAVTGALLGTVTGYALGYEPLGVLVWALIGAVVVSGAFIVISFFGSCSLTS